MNTIRELNNRVDALAQAVNKYINGGKGSGNFGHAGRPGEIGGSSTSGNPNPSKIEKSVITVKEHQSRETDVPKIDEVKPENIWWTKDKKIQKEEADRVNKKNAEWISKIWEKRKEFSKGNGKRDEKAIELIDTLIELQNVDYKPLNDRQSDEEAVRLQKRLQDALSALSPKYKKAVEEEKELQKKKHSFEETKRVDEDQYLAAQAVYKRLGIDGDDFYH